MQAAFARGDVNGIVAYDGDRPVWSVACFLIEKAYRRKGLSTRLLEAACDLAAGLGAEVLEGYPVEPPKTPYPPVYAWTGFAGTFRAAGFEEVARRSPTRPMMRKVLGA